jgi:geranylgeranyl diphosphate synthase type II
MDAADTRRGKETVHKKYNQNIAILAGDAMLIKSYQLLGEYQDADLKARLFDVFTELSAQLCDGQQMDMNFETTNDVKVDDYMEMIILKTGVLIAGALKMGALIGGATVEESDKLYGFGKNIGIAFQLQDDLLDTFGTFEKVGKKIGGDIVQNKKTYLYLKAIELAGEKGRQEIEDIYNDNTPLAENQKISTVTKLFKSLVVDEYARQVRDAYLDLSYAHLEAIDVAGERKEQLRALGQQLVNRDY